MIPRFITVVIIIVDNFPEDKARTAVIPGLECFNSLLVEVTGVDITPDSCGTNKNHDNECQCTQKFHQFPVQ